MASAPGSVSAPLRLVRARLSAIVLPYAHPVTWAGHAETGMDVVLLELETESGRIGVGEGIARVNWAGATPRSLITTMEEIFLPRLAGCDLASDAALDSCLGRIPEHALAKSMIDMAVADLRAQASGLALWQFLGGISPVVPLCWTLTRAAPSVMAAAADQARSRWGFTAFKIKTGQGLDEDRAVLQAVRRAVGDDAFLFADANRAIPSESIDAYARLLADCGIAFAEDPCPLRPDPSLALLQARFSMPVLIDNPCRNLAQARLFLEAGARALSVKVPKSGLRESLAIGALARDHGARAHVGIGAVSGLGAHAALALASAFRAAGPEPIPCEESFFLGLPRDLPTSSLQVKNGMAEMPDLLPHGLWGLIDWDWVRRQASP